LEVSGLGAFFENYPYWYLGTTPFRYLTGPFIPSLLVGLHRLFPSLSLFTIYYLLFTISWTVGGIGVYWLVKELENKRVEEQEWRSTAVFAAGFYLFGPIVPFLFRFSDGLYLITFSFLPFILLLYLRLLKEWNRRLAISLIILISFVILIDTLILPALILGMAAIFLAQVGWRKTEEKLKQSLLLIVYCLLLVTLWYTPGYWWTLLGAPSFGGKGLASVAMWLGKLLPVALALTAAVFSAKFFKKPNLVRDFCFYFLFIFGFLTLIRFLSDPDFWLDWSAYGTEIQFGLAILGGFIVSRLFEGKRYQSLILLCIFTLYFLQFAILFNKYVLHTFQRDITKTVEYRIGKKLSEVMKPHSASSGQAGERVFLSGTTVFWFNAFFDIPQVRGGMDQASVDPNWQAAAWEIREGTELEKSLKWLKDLEVKYLVIHTEESEEYYHDFVHPEKFERSKNLQEIYKEDGDRIYKFVTF